MAPFWPATCLIFPEALEYSLKKARMPMERIEVDKGGEESIVSGHLWIFSNQVKTTTYRLTGRGACPRSGSERGRFLGIGTYNSKSLIAVRVLSRERAHRRGILRPENR